MKVIGITGLIGSGKSVVMKLFGILYDIPTFNSDLKAKEIYYDSDIREKIIRKLGIDPITDEGSLNKDGLRQLVTGDAHMKNELETIVHNGLKEKFQSWVERQTSDSVIIESAILYTSGFHRFCDQIIQVTAKETTREARVLSRDNSMTIERFQQIVDIQREEAIRQANESNFTINNDGDISIVQQVENTYDKICKRNFKQ